MRQIRILRTESFRLAALFAAVFAGLAALMIAAAFWITGDALTSEVTDSINIDLAAIERGFNTEGIEEVEEIIQQRLATPGFSGFFLLQDRVGKKIAGNLPASAPRVGFLVKPLSLVDETSLGQPTQHSILGKGLVLKDGAYVFVGQDTQRVSETRRLILRTFGWIMAAAVALAIGGGALLSLGFLARIDAITQNCRAIIRGQLRSRIPIRGTRDELDQLAAIINDMLDRNETLMESLRQVSTDIAHDLRTPLMHMRHRLELTQAKAISVDAYAASVERAISDADEILLLFAALLSISQIEAGTRRATFVRLNLTDLLKQVLDTYRPVAEDREQRLEAHCAPSVMVQGDRVLLIQMFANIVENAIRHGFVRTKITVLLTADAGNAVVRIADSGPGIPSEEREKIFRRFYRLERSRATPGNGLGLALVSAIADLHGARVEFSDNNPGVCLTFTLPLGGEEFQQADPRQAPKPAPKPSSVRVPLAGEAFPSTAYPPVPG